jgi:hypothetical protein
MRLTWKHLGVIIITQTFKLIIDLIFSFHWIVKRFKSLVMILTLQHLSVVIIIMRFKLIIMLIIGFY